MFFSKTFGHFLDKEKWGKYGKYGVSSENSTRLPIFL
jgi:hypothetical protein